MPFTSSKTYLGGPWSPKAVAMAVAKAFEMANGVGRPFKLHRLKYSTTDGASYLDESPRLADFAAMGALPDPLELTVVDAGGSVEVAILDFSASEVRVGVRAGTADGLRSFSATLAGALSLSEAEPRYLNPPAADEVAVFTRPEVEAPSGLLIFTALQEERAILEESLGLKTAYEDQVARGIRHGVPIELISAKKMGRVPAAVSIATHLARSPRYRLIVAAGIAGGFAESSVERGAVVIASEIVDLATRKQHEAKVEFRPSVFQLDDTLTRFVRSTSFDREKWEKAVLIGEKWPAHLRPHLLEGALACTDEIVSSDTWRAELVKAWAKLQGIEMESGGACAAAEAFGAKIAVIRGISDLADPRKSDDMWRRLAMRAVAEVLDALTASGILLAPNG